jgi:polyisoprenoid-binding protein YceI
MGVAAGEYRVGSDTGRLVVRTYRQGVASKAGHDLVIEATEWEGRVTVPADAGEQPSVSVRVNLRGLTVVEGTGGIRPLNAGDKHQIQQTMREALQVDRHPQATFTSTAVDVQGDSATVEGELTLAGQTHPLRLRVRRQDDATVAGATSVVQSQWGIKPYSGLFGALKLRDAVDVEFTVALPAR